MTCFRHCFHRETEREKTAPLEEPRAVSSGWLFSTVTKEICALLQLTSVPRSTCQWICHTALSTTGCIHFKLLSDKQYLLWGYPRSTCPSLWDVLVSEGLSEEKRSRGLPQALCRNTLYQNPLYCYFFCTDRFLRAQWWMRFWLLSQCAMGVSFPPTLLFTLPTEDMKEHGTTEMAKKKKVCLT